MTQTDLLKEILKDNRSAIELIETLARASQVVDDMYDGDAEIKPSTVEMFLLDIMIELQRNEFYIKFHTELQPVIELGIFDWLAANRFERSGHEGLQRISYITRDQVYMVAVTAARIIGGVRHAVRACESVRRFLHTTEDFQEYVEGLSRG